MKKIYSVPVRFTGRIMYDVESDSEQEAQEKAAELASEADCGQLEDIDWKVKPAVSVRKISEEAM